MIIDKLYESVAQKGPICVGLDTKTDYVPDFMKKGSLSDSIFEFNKNIIELTKEYTAVYKVQIAYYEAYGIEGLIAFKHTLDYLKKNNLLTIADVKRGDISATAKMYAKAFFTGDFESDFITLNPYMGYDSIEPYLEYLENNEKGIFVLLKTSNPGSKDIESQKANGEFLYNIVGDNLQQMAQKFMGKCKYSSLALVTGATNTKEAVELRKRYSDMFLLIPGYGAQGATGDDALLFLKYKNGGVVNSSRGIIAKHTDIKDITKSKFESVINEAILKMRSDLKVGV